MTLLESVVSILFFFVTTYGIGYSLTFFLQFKNAWEQHIMRIGIGIAGFILLGIVLNLIHVPLHPAVFLVIALSIPLYDYYRGKFRISIPRLELYTLLTIVLVILLFGIMLYGSFRNPWLENGDPWEYAVAAQYVAEHHTFSKPADMNTFDYNVAHYAEPYPIAYSLIMGVIVQLSKSILWTLKFYNALFIGFALLFAYFFSRALTGSAVKAFLATFLLFVMPIFLTHFVFSMTLAVALLPVALYCAWNIREQRAWMIPTAISIAAVLETQMVAGATLGFLFLAPLIIILFFHERMNALLIAAASALGALLAGLYWVPMLFKYGLEGIKFQNAIGGSSVVKVGGADVYGLMDFITIPPKIDSTTGLGIVVFVLMLASLVFCILYALQKKQVWMWIVLSWFVLHFLNVNSGRLPLGFVPHRAWVYFAIPIALICAEGITQMSKLLHAYKVPTIATLAVFCALLVFNPGFTKFQLNTSIWPQHWLGPEELDAYLWLKELPLGTPVTSLCRFQDNVIIGFDKRSTSAWDVEQINYKKALLNKTPEETSVFLKRKQYTHFIIDGECVKRWGVNETNTLLQTHAESRLFGVARQTQGAIVFTV